jgi:hypothetical protein
MERGVNYRSVIEYFLLMQTENHHSVVYYNKDGTTFEKEIEHGVIDEALLKFEGGPKAVLRSTGGLVSAQAYQLVVRDQPRRGETAAAGVKIKVKFRDFHRDERGLADGKGYVTATKVLKPEEIREGFSFDLTHSQKFVLDLGQGMIPIYIFRFIPQPNGPTVALFVEADDLERNLTQPKGHHAMIQAYGVDRAVIRYATLDPQGPNEIEIAMKNYRRLKEQKKEVFPEWLRVGTPMDIPTNLSYQDFRRWMGRQINGQTTLRLGNMLTTK